MKNKKLDTGFKFFFCWVNIYKFGSFSLSIRKVCKSLRSFVDTKYFEFSNMDLCIAIDGDNCYLKIKTPDENRTLGYKKNEIGCSFWADPPIAYNSDYIQTWTIIGDTPLNVCMSDLGSILKHHKAPIDFFKFGLRAIDDVVILTEIIRETLMPEETRLKVNTVRLVGIDMKMMTRILSYLDEKMLNAINLVYDAESRNEREELDTGRMVKLAQWKNAKILSVEKCAVSFPIESIGHFYKVKLCFRQITIQDLLYLKEIFINSCVPRKFKIQSRSFDAENLDETFGLPFVTENNVQRKMWVFRVLVNRRRVVQLDYLERIAGAREITCFKFTHSEVPPELIDEIPW
ncbi:DUF38 domain-containing protein [Caenorhabditis elegans]|uniref:DUF38 domain-containing protein n=1 Tax=Caenorhabditis elegans TaxID=6239 RepID=Q9XVC2_CAEEL|nr:DUF38 domain-containing protein [Caenorhabditis elegans]CAB03950.1 DUF38 domain-containing protein [Caenorhabditis elegans]|eukprot:NP_507452.1 F-box A protein [Caenorhabditis elegans]